MTVSNMEATRSQLERSLERHQAMAEILRISLGDEDLADVLRQSLDTLLAVSWLSVEPRGAVFLLNPRTEKLELSAQVGLPCALLSSCAEVELGRCLCGQAALTHQLVYANCVDERHVIRYQGMHPHGHYCIPLISGQECLGVLTLYLKPGQERDEEEQQFLEASADVLAGVIKRKQAEQALHESEERFALAIRGTDAGIWDWNLVTDEVYFSPRWKSMLGYAEDEIENRFSEWESRLHPEDKDRAATTIRRYLTGQSVDYELEHRLQHRDGSYRWILARGAAVRDSTGKPYRMVGSHLDITDRKAMEQTYRAQEAQLVAASTIQEHIWPERPPKLPGYDIAAKVFPAEFAAGDHFDYFTLDDGSLVFLVADVAGHGFSSALLMASTHAYIRSLFSTGLELDEVLEHANSELLRDTELFVSIILGRLHPETGVFTYVNAGHPSGYVFDKTGRVKHELKSSVPPLAIISDTKFDLSEPVVLSPGDLLLLTTDGVAEACSPEQELFGVHRMLEVVRRHRDLSAEELIAALHDEVAEFCGCVGIEDDLTALVIRAKDSMFSGRAGR